ncbi:Oxidoreductase FAD-binding domain protein [Sphingobacterium sp. JB170]|nr:Oxidoreductase FAD-binding domain protein [Sphingobacterium sp. JB170]
MADAMESLFSGSYHPVTVTEVNYLEAELKHVRFEGDFSASKRKFRPGNVIEFRINETEFRHYTPSLFDHGRGVCDVLFYLHGMGPGSDWAATLKKGDGLKLLGPGGKLKFDINANDHFVFGDETSLGLMQSMYRAAEAQDTTCECLVELDSNHIAWTDLVDIPIHPVAKSPKGKAVTALPEVDCFLQRSDRHKTAFYLTGNAKSIQVIRKHLVNSGITASQIQSDPYWVEGKTGL